MRLPAGPLRGPGPVLAAWLVTRVLLLLCVLKVFTLPGPDVTSDVTVIYQGWSEVLRTGSFPKDDVTWQYPPGAALAVLSPGLLPFLGYTSAFFVLVCAADAAVFAMLLRAGMRTGTGTGTPTGGRMAGAWCWTVGVPLLGPTVYARYDLMVVAFAVAALLALRSRPRLAAGLAAFGAMLKVWPALLLLGTPRGRVTRVVWSMAAAVAALLGLLFAVTMPGAFGFLSAQRDRGVEIESLGALVFHVARRYGWEGEVQLHYGSIEFLGPHVGTVADASLLLSVAAFGWLVWWRLRAVEWTPSTPADAAFAAVLVFTTTSRVISPQYMVWLVGLAAVCVTLRSSRQGVPALLVLAATGVTVLEFPVWFGRVVAGETTGVGLLVVRNGLLVGAAVLACRVLWRTTVSAPRARGAAAPAGVPTGARRGSPPLASPAPPAPTAPDLPAGGEPPPR